MMMKPVWWRYAEWYDWRVMMMIFHFTVKIAFPRGKWIMTVAGWLVAADACRSFSACIGGWMAIRPIRVREKAQRKWLSVITTAGQRQTVRIAAAGFRIRLVRPGRVIDNLIKLFDCHQVSKCLDHSFSVSASDSTNVLEIIFFSEPSRVARPQRKKRFFRICPFTRINIQLQVLRPSRRRTDERRHDVS